MRRINITGIILLAAGIAIGIALTMISMHAVGVPGPEAQTTANTHQHKLIAEKSPPGAADAQTPQVEAAPQIEQAVQPAEQPAQEAKAPADWLKPEDLAKQNGAPSAVPAAPKYQSSHTEYYIYPTGPNAMGGAMPVEMPTTASGYPVSVGGGLKAVDYPQSSPAPWTVGDNGLMQNPCVDPPSCRRRTYKH